MHELAILCQRIRNEESERKEQANEREICIGKYIEAKWKWKWLLANEVGSINLQFNVNQIGSLHTECVLVIRFECEIMEIC